MFNRNTETIKPKPQDIIFPPYNQSHLDRAVTFKNTDEMRKIIAELMIAFANQFSIVLEQDPETDAQQESLPNKFVDNKKILFIQNPNDLPAGILWNARQEGPAPERGYGYGYLIKKATDENCHIIYVNSELANLQGAKLLETLYEAALAQIPGSDVYRLTQTENIFRSLIGLIAIVIGGWDLLSVTIAASNNELEQHILFYFISSIVLGLNAAVGRYLQLKDRTAKQNSEHLKHRLIAGIRTKN